MPQGSDAAQIAAIMKKQFERPDAPLAVEPVTVDGTVAIAGWIQGSKGGRAMLQKDAGQWMITLCAGADLVQAKALQATGLSASQATQLVKAVQLAESKLSPKQRQLFDSFEGMVKIDSAHGAHGTHGAAPAAAGKHH
ncbi:MAG: copper uptake system-associated protein [Rhodoferax sp.]|nr:copper uptake system-associated protein [Rhodoferax sp.]